MFFIIADASLIMGFAQIELGLECGYLLPTNSLRYPTINEFNSEHKSFVPE